MNASTNPSDVNKKNAKNMLQTKLKIISRNPEAVGRTDRNTDSLKKFVVNTTATVEGMSSRSGKQFRITQSKMAGSTSPHGDPRALELRKASDNPTGLNSVINNSMLLDKFKYFGSNGGQKVAPVATSALNMTNQTKAGAADSKLKLGTSNIGLASSSPRRDTSSESGKRLE